MTAQQILTGAKSILLIDYPGRIVPETLARAGFEVFVHGGPRPEDYFVFEARGAEVEERRTGRRPDHADLVFTYRPLAELADIVRTAQAVGATAIWFQAETGDKAPAADEVERGRVLVEKAGMAWIATPTIVEAAKAMAASR